MCVCFGIPFFPGNNCFGTKGGCSGIVVFVTASSVVPVLFHMLYFCFIASGAKICFVSV